MVTQEHQDLKEVPMELVHTAQPEDLEHLETVEHLLHMDLQDTQEAVLDKHLQAEFMVSLELI